MKQHRSAKNASIPGSSKPVKQHRAGSGLLLLAIAVAMAGCASEKPKSRAVAEAAAPRSKEYFPESKYGVKASPRVAYVKGKPLPRGGGRNQVGKPYQVKGRWYYPKEDRTYAAKGRASWYGEAFHGRLTANGELYDMAHLTAAHPTMPLPSYARVTNLANGSSVIVRVNDRGPYERDRVIDLSQKAAEMLDYQHTGTADVKVEYVGRAPLEGNDDSYLLASFNPGAGYLIGQPATGVMMAMNGPTPTARPITPAAVAMPTVPQAASMPMVPNLPSNSPFSINPAYGGSASAANDVPMPVGKPGNRSKAGSTKIAGLAGYAPSNLTSDAESAEDKYAMVLSSAAVSDAWKRRSADESGEYVELGLFKSSEEIDRLEKALPKGTRLSRIQTPTENGMIFEATARIDGGKIDNLLRAAWAAGANDAFVVRMD